MAGLTFTKSNCDLVPSTATDLASIVERFRPELGPFEEIYRDIHRNPELSGKEFRTASVVAEHFKELWI